MLELYIKIKQNPLSEIFLQVKENNKQSLRCCGKT